MVGDRLGMIAGRHGDHAAPAFVLAESGELDEGAAILERIGDLQVLVFDVDLGAGEGGKLRRGQHRGAQDRSRELPPRRLDIGKLHGHGDTTLFAPLPEFFQYGDCSGSNVSDSLTHVNR